LQSYENRAAIFITLQNNLSGENMEPDYAQLIKSKYESSRGDSGELFKAIQAAAADIGMDAALEILQSCVIEKRLAWVARVRAQLETSGDALQDGYHAFYERYLNVAAPQDGEIVERSERRIVMRWWNPCPTLEACKALGLDTRQVCAKAYEAPVQAMLSAIDPRLRFRRNYDAIRPYARYCEEIIEIE
jgi:hypothetical protein